MSLQVLRRRSPLGTGLEAELAVIRNPNPTPAKINSPPEDIDSLNAQGDSFTFDAFSISDAHELGHLLSARLRSLPGSSPPVLISISLASGLVVYQSTTGPGVKPDNELWVQRKRRSAMRWGSSTWLLHCKYGGDEEAFAAKFGMGRDQAAQYAIHGGAVPIYVRGVEGVVAVVVPICRTPEGVPLGPIGEYVVVHHRHDGRVEGAVFRLCAVCGDAVELHDEILRLLLSGSRIRSVDVARAILASWMQYISVLELNQSSGRSSPLERSGSLWNIGWIPMSLQDLNHVYRRLMYERDVGRAPGTGDGGALPRREGVVDFLPQHHQVCRLYQAAMGEAGLEARAVQDIVDRGEQRLRRRRRAVPFGPRARVVVLPEQLDLPQQDGDDDDALQLVAVKDLVEQAEGGDALLDVLRDRAGRHMLRQLV
ncbi:protein of unknown function (DUF336) [Geosmithia morbida]|uniref:Uncharacterized protein n=1 Tax=Geosmithia morbida TaxID=1094350 RepID=A0A9P4YUC8_9HYPO|nr:protein of unknown function (DUF336) [Geosmithia morbida]KAF4121841.1 protein of unknown function (DUF336) [Geosmithia morbida]